MATASGDWAGAVLGFLSTISGGGKKPESSLEYDEDAPPGDFSCGGGLEADLFFFSSELELEVDAPGDCSCGGGDSYRPTLEAGPGFLFGGMIFSTI